MADERAWAGRSVLLTGHSGFKGSWLALWLETLGARVTGFSGPPPSAPSLYERARVADGLDDLRGDVRDPASVRAAVRRARPEIVLHLAAQALVRPSLEDPAGTYATNVLGTAHVLDAVRAEAPAAAVLVVTSDKCYAEPSGDHRCTEDDPLGGRDPYSSSKAAQEHVAAAYRATFGLRVATARAGNVIGGGDWGRDRLVPDLVRAAAAGQPLTVRNPSAVRPWQHVLNPLAGYLQLAERLAGSPTWARAFNFGPAAEDERPVSWVVARMAERWPGGVEVSVAAGEPGTVEAPALRLDSARAQVELGWSPVWDLPAGVDATVAWHARVAGGDDPRAVTLEQIQAFEASRS